jgi:predicted PurR-regulated permease PerM
MGFLGLFIGPVLMALLVAIWREWMHEVRTADQGGTGPEIIIDEQAPPSQRAAAEG